jgi:hypothetical protein
VLRPVSLVIAIYPATRTRGSTRCDDVKSGFDSPIRVDLVIKPVSSSSLFNVFWHTHAIF